MLETILSEAIATALPRYSPAQILQGLGIEDAIASNAEIMRHEQVMDFVVGHLVSMGAIAE